jgi:hypothetical protein
MITRYPPDRREGLPFLNATQVKRWAYPDLPRAVVVVNSEASRTTVRTAITGTQFGGLRMWLVCPGRGCGRRVAGLYIVAQGPRCRVCAKVRSALYKNSKYHGRAWWTVWGRAAHHLAKVRQHLARPYLRLSRRGLLERQEAALVARVLRGVQEYLS